MMLKRITLIVVMVACASAFGANSIENYQKACDLNDGVGCTLLGNSYYSGNGVKQDYFKANEYFKKACDLNYGGGCAFLGNSYHYGLGVNQDLFKANEYFKKGVI
ncbi:tetratricopeptide repeat protein [Succinatimonas hippei]|uniref:tetratricopeptide repeat protein n=1 Tax=Succinatimonas hippei TaxID=626938 RepID=UPI0023FA05C0|nr:tetratricopeptide repeat protein [Succinatimonas hippei]